MNQKNKSPRTSAHFRTMYLIIQILNAVLVAMNARRNASGKLREEMMMTPATVPNQYDQAEIVETIKKTVAQGATDSELRMFLEVCRSTGLNPFLKEIWFVAGRVDRQTGKQRPGIIMAARDGYLRVANENPNFDGIETRVERDAKMTPVKAVCTVWRKDRSHPTICEAYFNEYVKQSQVWEQYPSAMISKVAEVLALKRSFAINGVVTEEEIGNGEPQSGWEGLGTKEAARAKGEEIIADLKAGKSYRGPVPPTEKLLEASIDKAQQEKTKPNPKNKNFKMLKEFRELHKLYNLLGKEENYYGILGEYGVSHSNEFPEDAAGIKLARQCYKAMGKDIGKLREEAAAIARIPEERRFTGEWPDNPPEDGQPFLYNGTVYQFHEESGNWREVK